MDADRFDCLTRAVGAASRRGVARFLAAAALAGPLASRLAPGPTLAGKKHKKQRKGSKKRCGKRCIPKSHCCSDANCPGDQICQGGACLLPFCASKNYCSDSVSTCDDGSAADRFCFVTASGGKPFCGQTATVHGNGRCLKGEVRVSFAGAVCEEISQGFTTGCSRPCETLL